MNARRAKAARNFADLAPLNGHAIQRFHETRHVVFNRDEKIRKKTQGRDAEIDVGEAAFD